ncbi:MAG: uroporphyrinogen-III synthase [Aliihoeflea sp.]
MLVTRPEPGASATAQRLGERGFEPVVLPLTRILPIAPGVLPERVDIVVATSANAFRHAPPDLLKLLRGKPLYVVGEKTAEASKVPVDMVAPDATTLAERMVASLRPSLHVLYLAGRVRGAALKERLEQAGHHVTELEVYDAVPTGFAPGEIGTKLGTAPFWSALVYSQRGGEILSHVVAQAPALFASTVFVCLSREAGVWLRSLGRQQAFAAMPDEAGMMAALERLG